MEVMIQTLPISQSKFDHGFNFTPFSTPPSTPKRRFVDSFYFSAPTSPTTKAYEFSSVFHDDDDDDDGICSKSVIPFDWEEKPGTPKSLKSVKNGDDDDDVDFAFDFSSELEKKSLPADELFHDGQIKPLKPPPGGLNLNEFVQNQNPISRKASFFSSKKKQSDKQTEHHGNENRGREILTKNSSRRGGSRETRSLSPYRVNSHYPFDESDQISISSTSTTTNSSKARKWSFRNFLLFRSASEGRAKEPLRKYFSFFSSKQHDHDSVNKHSRLRQHQPRKTESFNTGLTKKNRGGGGPVLVSAHEMHYTKNRAVSEDLKKRSFLPYKHGIMGRFSFNHHI